MADYTFVARDMRPLPGAIIRDAYIDTGQTITPGQAVYISGEKNGKPEISLADADAVGSARIWGVVVSVGTLGSVSGGAGEMCSVVVFGPVTGFTDLDPGAPAYASTTAGDLEDGAPAGASGDFVYIAGIAETAETLFVNPFTYDVAAQ